MRNVTSVLPLCCIFSFFLFSACTKAVNDPADRPEQHVYTISAMDLFLADDDILDTAFSRLDTVTVINSTSHPLPDTTIYPYQSLRDSVYVTLTSPSPDTLTLADSVSFRRVTVHPGADGAPVLSTLPQDSVAIAGFPATVDVPLLHVDIAETFAPTPKTKYQITGEYWRVRYTVSFRAYAVRPSDGHTQVLQGKIRYSKVSISGYEGPESHPKAVITIISDLE